MPNLQRLGLWDKPSDTELTPIVIRQSADGLKSEGVTEKRIIQGNSVKKIGEVMGTVWGGKRIPM
jgi:hypothetical protein